MGLLNALTSIIGIGDALGGGLKVVDLNVTKAKNIQELYDEIKDIEFKVGEPFIDKVPGAGNVIAFPALDKNNQVQIWYQRKKFFICRGEHIAGNKKFMASMALDSLTDGLTALSGSIGKNKDICNQLVVEMADKLNAMDL